MKNFEQEYPNVKLDIYQGTYNDVYQWLKDGVVDLGFLSESSVGELAWDPIYKDRIVCAVPKGYQTEKPGCVTIEELKHQRFVVQREGCDADVNNLITKYEIPADGGSRIVDDISAIALVMGGYGVYMVPELVTRNIPFPVDVYPLEVEESRTIVLAYARSDIQAPAVSRVREYILDRFQNGMEQGE